MSPKLKSFLLKAKYPLALIVFGVFVGFVGESSLVNRCSHKAEINRLETEIADLNAKFEEEKETLRRLDQDPEAIKEIAREKYYMKTDNEDVYVIADTEEEGDDE